MLGSRSGSCPFGAFLAPNANVRTRSPRLKVVFALIDDDDDDARPRGVCPSSRIPRSGHHPRRRRRHRPTRGAKPDDAVLTEERGRRRPSALSKEKRRHTNFADFFLLGNKILNFLAPFLPPPPPRLFFGKHHREKKKREKKEDKSGDEIRFATKTTTSMRYSSLRRKKEKTTSDGERHAIYGRCRNNPRYNGDSYFSLRFVVRRVDEWHFLHDGSRLFCLWFRLALRCRL